MSLTCPLCQTDNPDRATSCSVCGSTLQPSKITLPSSPPPSPTQPTIPIGSPPFSRVTSPVQANIPPHPQTGKTQPSSSHTFALPLPTTLQNGRYQLQRVLGEGGFAITYKAIDIQTQKTIVIKERWPVGGARKKTGEVLWTRGTKRQEEIQKFQEEAALLKKCHHGSIVSCYDFFEEKNTCYIVMDFVDGQSLYDHVQQQGLLSDPTARQYLVQLTEALEVVHGQRILHRDIKPENIMLDRAGSRAVLIDFGIAREFQENMTQDMTTFVSVYYSPLEQLSRQTKRTASADLFSLCASFYYAVTGQEPLPSTDRVKNLASQQPDNLPPPQQLGARISSELENIILMGMEIDIKNRFISATHLLEHLRGNPIPRSLFALQRKLSSQQGQTIDLYGIAQDYKNIIQQEPLQPKTLLQLQTELAHILLHLAQWDEVLHYAQAAYQLDANYSPAQGILGLIACRQGCWQDAVTFLQSAHRSDPNQGWIGVYLGLALIQTQQIPQAQRVLQPWLNQLPQRSFSPSLQAHIQSVGAWLAFHQRDWKAVIGYSRQTLKLLRDTGDSQLQSLKSWLYPCLVLATAEAVKGRGTLDVERCLDEFEREVPSNSFSMAYRSWQQWHLNPQGSPRPIAFMQVSQPTAATPTWILFNQGLIAEQNQNLTEAETLYRECFQRSADDARIAGRLGWVLGQQGRWQEAVTVMESVGNRGMMAHPSLTVLETAQFWHNQGWVILNLLKTQGLPTGGSPGAAQNLYNQLKLCYQHAIDHYRQDPNSQAQIQQIQDILDQLP